MDRAVFYVIVSPGEALAPAELLAAAARAGGPLPEHASNSWPLLLGSISVEATAPSDAPLPSLREAPQELAARLAAARSAYQLRFVPGVEEVAEALVVARLLLGEVGGVIADVSAARYLDAEQLERICGGDDFDIDDHVVLHVVQRPEEAAWVHTHGMGKLGAPDLEAYQVPAAAVGELSALFNDLCTDLAFGEGPDEGELFELPGGQVLLRPAGEARGEETGLSAADLRGHDGAYLTLTPAEGEELGAVLHGYGTLEMKSDEEVEAERAAAQSLLSRFVERAGRPAEGEEFYVKAPFPVHGPGGETQEHMWVALRNVGGGVIAGALASSSFYEPERWPEGTAVQVLLAEVEALAVVNGGEVVPEDELDGYLS